MSFTRLASCIKRMGNPTVVGLDPRIEYVPTHIRDAFPGDEAKAILEFNKGLIDALCDIVPAVKPQSAYYEALGVNGAAALAATIDYARGKGMYVIADIKRGDIGATAEAYAEAYLGENAPYRADCVTVNPYLGIDGVRPFLDLCTKNDKAIFLLVKTSNPSSGDFQDIDAGGMPLYMRVAQKVLEWGHGLIDGEYSRCGIVVGATYPPQLSELRKMMSGTFFLVPGYGAQGAAAADVAGAFCPGAAGVVVNSSRALMCAWQKQNTADYQQAARAEALRMRDEIVSVL